MTNAALARSNIALVSRPPAARTGLPVPPFAVANVAPSKPAAQRGRYVADFNACESPQTMVSAFGRESALVPK
jgi:hypothetical protein